MAATSKICGISIGGKIGEGSYGTVYQIKDENKVLKIPDQDSEYKDVGVPQPLELVVLTQLRHENLMWAERVVGDATCKGISWVMPRGISDLHKYIPVTPLTVYQRLDICFRVTCAVKFLLDNKILHLDLKPSNIIMERVNDTTVRPLLADFGMAALMDDPKVPIVLGTRPVISLATRPPENLPSEERQNEWHYEQMEDKRTYGEHTLVWGLGMIFQYVFTEVYVNTGDRNNEVENTAAYLRKYYTCDGQRRHTIESFAKGFLDAEHPLTNDIIDLITAMLAYNLKERITLADVLKNGVFRHLSATNVLSEKRPVIEGKSIPIPIPPVIDVGAFTVERLLAEAKDAISRQQVSAGIVLDAIDLVYRGMTLISLLTPIRRRLYSKVCLYLGMKIHEWEFSRRIRISDMGRFTAEEAALFLVMEQELIVALAGQLRRPYIYDASSMGTFKQALELISSPRRYLTVVLSTLRGPGSQVKPTIATLFKDLPYAL